MDKETLIKLLILFNISKTTINYCTVFGVKYREVEEYKYRIFAEHDGRIEI